MNGHGPYSSVYNYYDRYSITRIFISALLFAQPLLQNVFRNMETNRSMSQHTQTQQNAATVSFITPISQPIFRSVDPAQVTTFVKVRESYKLEIEPKQSDVTFLKVLSYNVRIYHEVIDNLVIIGKF